MGRPYRTALGGHVYHMLNRGNGRLRIFHKDGDYEAFERILGEALEHVPAMRLLAYDCSCAPTHPARQRVGAMTGPPMAWNVHATGRLRRQRLRWFLIRAFR